MVIDSSAILAIYFQEPTAPWVAQQINSATCLRMSIVNLAEALMRIGDRQPVKAQYLGKRLLAESIDFVPPDAAQALLAADARLRFPLNFGDCFAYALARTMNEPLLTLDRDFQTTDIKVILPLNP